MQSFLPGREEVGKREEKEMEGKKRRVRVFGKRRQRRRKKNFRESEGRDSTRENEGVREMEKKCVLCSTNCSCFQNAFHSRSQTKNSAPRTGFHWEAIILRASAIFHL